ncbi:NrpR regulatory domain-containing protein [Candidatus Bathyarchaeota archaeon]|nr:NrpR regulatory domain-containing protein [Candidatus Bathyarchaeota archaeon]
MSSLQNEDARRKELEILRILSEYDRPVGSTVIQKELQKRGFFLSERTIRYHLQLLQSHGLTEGHSRDGRTITAQGLEELENALAYQRIGFVLTDFLSMAFKATYDPLSEKGNIVANVSFVEKTFRENALAIVKTLKRDNLLPAPYIKILDEGQEYQNISVPKEKIALFTVCNLTIDGVLMHSGIPLIMTYGGLVQFLNKHPVRFTELISYEGTTIPPLEVFVYRGMTSINNVLRTGSGMVPANLREIPASARTAVQDIITSLAQKGWGGILAFGQPNEPVLGVPIGMDRVGISTIGGLVPSAAIQEMGAHIDTFAPHCVMPVEDMERI